MSHRVAQWKYILAVAELVSLSCLPLVFLPVYYTLALFLSAVYAGWRSMELQNMLGWLPHEALLALAKQRRKMHDARKVGSKERGGFPKPETVEEVKVSLENLREYSAGMFMFCAVVSAPPFQLGVRVLLACGVALLFASFGLDRATVCLSLFVLLLFGLGWLIQKSGPTFGPAVPLPKTNAKVRQGFLIILFSLVLGFTVEGVTALILSVVLFMVGVCRAVIGAMETR